MTYRYPRGGAVRNMQKTHCPRGHSYEGDNLIRRKSGARVCRACKKIVALNYREMLARIRARRDSHVRLL